MISECGFGNKLKAYVNPSPRILIYITCTFNIYEFNMLQE